MADANSTTIEVTPKSAPRRVLSGRVPSSSFKYYIHDSVHSCRLELLGELSESDLPEMTGCWQTVKTTLGARQLILDLRRLANADAAGGRWLADMGAAGAKYVPDSYLSDLSNTRARDEVRGTSLLGSAKLSLLGRVLGLIRGGFAAEAD